MNTLVLEVTKAVNQMETEEELHAAFEAIRTRQIYIRSLKNLNVKMQLYKGAAVAWTGKSGRRRTGEIQKINKTTASVLTNDEPNSQVWTVTLSLLTAL